MHRHDALCDPTQCPPTPEDLDHYITQVLPDIDAEENAP